MKDITEYMQTSDGGHNRSFTVDGVKVLVQPINGNDDAAKRVTYQLYSALPELERLRLRCQQLGSKVPPNTPQRLFGPGTVRFRDGELWLLNRREGGWASWGVRLDSWDDLFRRYNVAVTVHGVDEHGTWWEVDHVAPLHPDGR